MTIIFVWGWEHVVVVYNCQGTWTAQRLPHVNYTLCFSYCPLDSGRTDLMVLFEGSQEVSKKAYEQVSERARSLDEELTKLRLSFLWLFYLVYIISDSFTSNYHANLILFLFHSTKFVVSLYEQSQYASQCLFCNIWWFLDFVVKNSVLLYPW